MKINGLIKKALYENIKCICTKGDITKSYPLIKCDNCNFKKAWDSVPQKDFIVKDEKGKEQKVNEIFLVRGNLDEVIGWNWYG